MERENSKTVNWSTQRLVETFPIWLLGISTVCLISGVLIVNVHLAKFGISSNELLRTEHMLAGAVFITFLLIFHWAFKYAIKYGRNAKAKWVEGKVVSAFFEFIAVLMGFCAPLFFAVFLVIGGDEIIEIKTIVKTIGGIYLAWLLTFAIFNEIKRSISLVKEGSSLFEENFVVQDWVMAIVGLVMGLSLYASISYPNISSTYGGGSRAQVILVLNAEGVEVCKRLALPMPNERMVGPIDVLLETESSISVLTNDVLSGRRVAIQLRRDLIDAVQAKTGSRYGK